MGPGASDCTSNTLWKLATSAARAAFAAPANARPTAEESANTILRDAIGAMERSVARKYISSPRKMGLLGDIRTGHTN